MKLKKVIAVLSVLCMMMTMYINGTGHSFIIVDAKENTESTVESSETTEDPYSGSCGENAVWAFDTESGTLTISGTGDMNNYRSGYLDEIKPWEKYENDITSIVIEEGITKIGDGAFDFLKNITNIAIPKSVKIIGESPFFGCENLQNIEVVSGNSSFRSVDGILFNNNMTNLIKVPIGKKLRKYTVYDGVERISKYAFEKQRSLESIILPKNLKDIGDWAFYNCRNLTEVVIPEGTESIDFGAFYDCRNLVTIEIPKSANYICGNAFSGTKFYSNLEAESEDFIIINNILLGVNSSDTKIVVPSHVVSISGKAFSNLSNLTEVIIPDGCIIYENAFLDCKNLKIVTLGNDCIISNAGFNLCSLEILTAGNNCTLGHIAHSKNLQCTINGTLNIIGNPFTNYSDKTTLKYERPALDYKYQDNSENKSNKAIDNVHKLDDINISDTFSSKTSYNNGYLSVDDVQEIQDSTGTLYAAVKYDNGVAIVPYDANEETMNFSKEDFKFGSAVFDDKDNIYILWAKSISDYNIDKTLEEEYANVVVVKYDKSGNVITEYGFPVNLMESQFPYDAGNAHLGWKNDVLLVYFHTEWTDFGDGLHHQGSVAAAVNTETSEIIYSSGWQGSHAFGSCMIPTDYGYAAIQMGDATARGINFNSYCFESPEEFKDNYIAINGCKSLYHSSGQYGTNEHHLDGNTTYTHMGGLAKSNTTYAIAGKSERVYTSDIYYSSDLRTRNYDVFVKLCDQTLLSNVSGLAGESRIDEATGEIADRNVVWLTECNETEKAGQVKIATLEDGSYCVLWEKFVNDNFDSIRYVIMDECGNIIRRETAINNARLSDTSVQPVVDGDTLKWAVGNGHDNSLIWYTVNLNEFTTDTTTPVQKVNGDVNNDGTVDVIDVILISRHLAGGWNVEVDKTVADVNNDNEISIADIVIISRYLAGGWDIKL